MDVRDFGGVDVTSVCCATSDPHKILLHEGHTVSQHPMFTTSLQDDDICCRLPPLETDELESQHS